jgi:hypothetical protein
MERRLKRLSAILHGGDSDAVLRCADYLYWAMRCTPFRVSDVGHRWQAYHGYIARSGVNAADVPRALSLALARLTDLPVADMAGLVDAAGADLLLVAMALPPQYRVDFIAQQPAGRVPFLDGLLASGA